MNDLQIQQNKAAKIIVDKAKYSSATNALEILKREHLDESEHNTAFHNYNTRKSV